MMKNINLMKMNDYQYKAKRNVDIKNKEKSRNKPTLIFYLDSY